LLLFIGKNYGIISIKPLLSISISSALMLSITQLVLIMFLRV
jgi:hypothetical protein